jgi:hypothetical protein
MPSLSNVVAHQSHTLSSCHLFAQLLAIFQHLSQLTSKVWLNALILTPESEAAFTFSADPHCRANGANPCSSAFRRLRLFFVLSAGDENYNVKNNKIRLN